MKTEETAQAAAAARLIEETARFFFRSSENRAVFSGFSADGGGREREEGVLLRGHSPAHGKPRVMEKTEVGR